MEKIFNDCKILKLKKDKPLFICNKKFSLIKNEELVQGWRKKKIYFVFRVIDETKLNEVKFNVTSKIENNGSGTSQVTFDYKDGYEYDKYHKLYFQEKTISLGIFSFNFYIGAYKIDTFENINNVFNISFTPDFSI